MDLVEADIHLNTDRNIIVSPSYDRSSISSNCRDLPVRHVEILWHDHGYENEEGDFCASKIMLSLREAAREKCIHRNHSVSSTNYRDIPGVAGIKSTLRIVPTQSPETEYDELYCNRKV